ncbi:MAG: tRNA dihydrouridine synthase DusB [Gammaproteobacteria bacterium]|nr:MAG: tRNA dihydrouridine synthase DusB [Gammaproteobacteria bacterium]
MHIGPYHFKHGLFLAPMSGITDKPFRQLCRSFGAELAFSEMTTSQAHLWNTQKSRKRMDFSGEMAPIAVQIAGTEPLEMANAAKNALAMGAQIIDINMGCPARKVCNVAAGSALMRDEARIEAILDAVVDAVDAPVTLKMRTGWDRKNRNAAEIAALAETVGVQALTVHGRTRSDMYRGEAEYDTIRQVKSAVGIPVIANGDICLENSQNVLQYTGADGIMIGRAARGRPWVFRQIVNKLEKDMVSSTEGDMLLRTVLDHITAVHRFYGSRAGVRIARKHIVWYLKDSPGFDSIRSHILQTSETTRQIELVREFLSSVSKGNQKKEKAA